MDITINDIILLFKNTTTSKKSAEIKNAIIANLYPEQNLFDNNQQEIENIKRHIDKLLQQDRKLGNESLLRYSKGSYRKRPKHSAPTDPQRPTSTYIGTAGEMAVISELMFHGYNANKMFIDEGIDIVATKNNIYSYIQVKTTCMENGTIYCQIKQENYDTYIQNQIRYIIVARYNDKGIDRNIFFVFNSLDISKGIYGKYIKQGQNCISIKIRFNAQDGKFYLYDNTESDISWHLNNFSLV